jgi:hypothetical protein
LIRFDTHFIAFGGMSEREAGEVVYHWRVRLGACRRALGAARRITAVLGEDLPAIDRDAPEAEPFPHPSGPEAVPGIESNSLFKETTP